MNPFRKIIATDFDGTLCEHKYPDIGSPNREVLNYLISQKQQGNRIILWTCRVNEDLQKAVDWCKKQGLTFDAVNQNLPDIIEEFGCDARKVFAHEYIDDRANNKFRLPYIEPEGTLHDVLLTKTQAEDVVVIQDAGWQVGVTYIDHEDLFIGSLSGKILSKPVKKCGYEKRSWASKPVFVVDL